MISDDLWDSILPDDDINHYEEKRWGFPPTSRPAADDAAWFSSRSAQLAAGAASAECAKLREELDAVDSALEVAGARRQDIAQGNEPARRMGLAESVLWLGARVKSLEASLAGVGNPQPNPAQVTIAAEELRDLRQREKEHIEEILDRRVDDAHREISDNDLRQQVTDLRQQVTDLRAQLQRVSAWYADGSPLFGPPESGGPTWICKADGCGKIVPPPPDDLCEAHRAKPEAEPRPLLVCPVCGSRGKTSASHRPPGKKAGAYCSGRRCIPSTPPPAFETSLFPEAQSCSVLTAEPGTTAPDDSPAGPVRSESGEGGEA